MANEIYTAEERALIDGVKALTETDFYTKALALDLLLLEMEEKQGLIDGVPVVKGAQ